MITESHNELLLYTKNIKKKYAYINYRNVECVRISTKSESSILCYRKFSIKPIAMLNATRYSIAEKKYLVKVKILSYKRFIKSKLDRKMPVICFAKYLYKLD